MENPGGTTPVSSWVDSVFLTSGTTLDSSAVLIGRQTHMGVLTAGGMYQATLTAPLPGLLPGNYFVIVETDSGDQVPDVNRSNNVLVSTTSLPVTVPALNLGSSMSGTVAAGQELYYALTLPTSNDVQLTLTSSAPGVAELLESNGAVPSLGTFDQEAFATSAATQGITLSSAPAGTYYVLVDGRDAAGTGASFTLSATALPFAITSLSPAQGRTSGR